MKSLTLSVIVPVYNEGHHIGHCLDALFEQSIAPDEIIIVDNNCTDNTLEIVRLYKGVKIVHEPKQGLIAARNKGFETATSDIMCRIDADALLEKDWLKKVQQAFMDDASLSGVTGSAWARALPRLPVFRTRLFADCYFLFAKGHFGTEVMWGANMAIRRKFWPKLRGIVCTDDALVHEDQDLTLSLLSVGGTVKKLSNLTIRTEGQVYHYFPKLFEYNLRAWKTRKYHKSRGRWPVPEAVRISTVYRWFLISFTYPGLAFFTFISFLFWPIDHVMIRIRGDEKNWLE